MPPIVKIKKEDIIDTTFEIIRKEGLEAVNARKIAQNLNCSVQPIFSNFENMEDLKKCTLEKIALYFYKFIINLYDDKLPKYKQVGMNYIKFAKQEPIFYKILFLENHSIRTPMLEADNEDLNMIKQYIESSTNLTKENIQAFHVKMWIFTHGLATLVSSKNIDIPEKQISDLISKEFQALMLLEENPNNKWVIKEDK